MDRRKVLAAVCGGLVLTLGGSAVAAGPDDAGLRIEQLLAGHSMKYFGVKAGLPSSSTASIDAATATANPLALATLAPGLKARVVTSGQAGPNLDMAALWPPSSPQWLISCNEQGASDPALQRINLVTGVATTIATGLVSCDPAHTTPWGTVIFGEEAGSTGAMYEMLDPLAVTNVVIDRVNGVVSGGTGSSLVVRRDALGFLSFEGIGFLPSGVAYYGDELSPASGAAAGSYYKFIPSSPWTGAPVTSLAASPLASGHVFGLQVGQGSNTGPGMSYGDGVWVPLAAGQLRPQASAAHLTGYYRPEDLNLDEGLLASGGVRFCGNNTGREEAHYYGETICVRDGTLASALGGTSVPQVSLLVAGSPAINMPDNIAYQPHRGNWIIHEDAATEFEGPHNNDLWSCLDDGGDANLQSDGCLRIGTLNDLTAEWTGGLFDPTGKHFYVSIQHNITGKGVILDITGWL
ncbi:MAG: hypothetical protein M3O55_04035 [Actinomycetota bacterium]|nr:hypothetical protein [Actinomycetota bacterium]